MELDTPALRVDLDKMEKNIQTTQAALTKSGFQPSARKTHVRRHREGASWPRVHPCCAKLSKRGDGRQAWT